MMVITAKVKKRNILILLAALIAILAVILFPARRSQDTLNKASEQKITTNEDRVAFLKDCGWDVEPTPAETQEVVIPAQENDVFTRYNELQKSQGYDLQPLAGKTVKRYVYEIKNHPDAAGTYRATLLIHRDRIVGGDVASTEQGGKMYGLQSPA